MRFMKRGINREVLLIIATALLLSTLNSLHVIIQWIVNPPGRLFTGIAHYYADYFLYVSQMAQGAAGSWVWATHQFTNEPMPSTWIYWFNVTVGHLGSLVGLSPFATYNVVLFVLSFILLILWYTTSSLIFPKSTSGRLFCFFLIVTATSFYNLPLLFQTKQLQLLGQFWYSPTLAFNRLGGVPHQIFQSILLLLLMIIYAQCISPGRPQEEKQPGLPLSLRFLLITILAFVTAAANPIQIVPFVLACGLVTCISIFTTKSNRRVLFVLFLCLGLAAFIGAILTTKHFKVISVLEAARAWDVTQYFSSTLTTFLYSVGPIVLFIPFGIWKWIKNPASIYRLFFFYGSLSFLFFVSPIPQIFSTQRLRWIHPVSYALLPALAAHGIIQLIQWSNRLHISKRTATMLLLAFYLVFTVPSLGSEIQTRITPQKNPYLLLDTEYNHVPQLTVWALTWLKQQSASPDGSVVLTDPKYAIEILVPVLTGKISFTGHPIHTLYPEQKERMRQEFFKGAMSQAQAKTFLRSYHIGFILAAPVTGNNVVFGAYPFLQKVYENDRIMIERVISD